jgi:sugar phosphate isomerase/epimerase
MELLRRRKFLQVVGAATGIAASGKSTVVAKKGVRLGLIVWIADGQDPDLVIGRVRKFGISSCQVGVIAPAPNLAGPLKAALNRHQVEGTAVACLGPGKTVWNFKEGPTTIGLVPKEYRSERIDALKQASDLAQSCGIPAIHTHCGFIPEWPGDPLYPELVSAINDVASYCRERRQTFLFETGQETPITLLRTIRDVGLDNLGVNLDTANLILYGKGNPVDALDVIGKYVRGLHAKDGMFPTDPDHLGEEVAIGRGKVDFPALIGRLKQLNYDGPITIEREIEGPQQTEDIFKSKQYLEKLIREMYGSESLK